MNNNWSDFRKTNKQILKFRAIFEKLTSNCENFVKLTNKK